MNENRSLLFHGLGLTLRRLPALLWAFLFNFVFSALTVAHIAGSIGKITDTSLAAEPLRHGFDLGTMILLSFKLNEGTGLSPNSGVSILLYLATYFLIVPGTLLCYQTGIPARLSTILQAGLMHFWRFVRITVLAGLVMALILGPLFAIYSRYSAYVDDHIVGRPGVIYELLALVAIALVAAILRLYFDLVEVYTVQLGLQLLASGKPDRRVRKTLLPALRALRRNFGRSYLTFLFLSFLGFGAMGLAARFSIHSLAQPRVWPTFLITQAGLFLMLLTRFWQRGAETTLSLDYPILEAPIGRTRATFVPNEPAPVSTISAAPIPFTHAHVTDPIPQPEPSTPSLPEPDPAIYHHNPGSTPEPVDPDPSEL
ncbi:hypothetical protein [Granulicella arctica]|uniref:hypothetical protein n=1 Tax=Granulicella arctica TaxID=940613 RepID=UPI0021DF5EF0|nr:hypothetical protein [Granulicella arctica]